MPFNADVSSCFRRLGLAACVAAAVGAGGCASRTVRAAPEPPPLAVPVVPPRIVGPVVVETEAPSPPVAQTPPPQAEPRPATRTPRPRPADQAAARAEPQPKSEQAPSADGGAIQSPAEPAPLLRTPETADDGEVIRTVRETLLRAGQKLAKVNQRSLSTGARAQYDMAKQFIAQAEGALRDRNLTFARFLADKADTLSSSLVHR